MIVMHPQFVIDENQEKKAVILSFSEWEALLEAVEDIEDVKAYDRAKDGASDILDFNVAVAEINNGLLT